MEGLPKRRLLYQGAAQVFMGLFWAAFGALLQWFLWPWVGPSRFLLFYPMVMVSAIVGGLVSGLCTTFSGAALSVYLFFPPVFSFIVKKPEELIPVALFVMMGSSITLLVQSDRKRKFELASERGMRWADRLRAQLLENLIVGYARCKVIYDRDCKPTDFICLDINQAFETIFNIHKVAGLRMSQLIPGFPQSKPEFLELIGRVALGGDAECSELYISEARKWIKFSAYFVREPEQFAMTFEDITALKVATQALELSSLEKSKLLERFNQAQRISQVGSWDWDLITNQVWWSDETYRIFEVNSKDYHPSFEGNSKWIHPDDLPEYRQRFELSLKTGEPLKWDVRLVFDHHPIKYCSVSGSIIRDAGGKSSHFIGTILDLTGRRKVDQALIESGARLRLAIQASNIGLWDWNPKTGETFLSREWKEQLGFADQELSSRYEEWSSRLHPDDAPAVIENLNRVLSGDAEKFTHEFRLRHKDGGYRWISSQAQVMRNREGAPTRVLGCHIDITDRKENELQLVRAKAEAENANRAKTRFLDIAAHELRTPVAAFSLLLQLIQKKLEVGQSVDPSLVLRVRGQVDRLSRLVVELLDVSRLERGMVKLQKSITGLDALILECIDAFRLQVPERLIRYQRTDPFIQINLDPVRVYQVLVNLIDNAFKYTQENAPIEISVTESAGFVRVSVRDQGPGMTQQQQRNLFIPFERGVGDQVERVSGLGLGLYISRGIIELHGGHVGVESQEGVGSTFFFELPLDTATKKIA